jgi:superoxide dismutase
MIAEKEQKIELSTYLDTYIASVYNSTEASKQQISIIALAMFGTLLSYTGLQNCNLYVADLSVSGSGKTQNINLQKDILLDEMLQLQQAKQKPEKFEEKHNNIHASKLTAAALFKSLEYCRTQYIQIDELGLSLKNKTENELIQYLIQLYGSSKAAAPSLIPFKIINTLL